MSLTLAEILRLWDARRARSQQVELGMSDLGSCERRAGYREAGVEPSDPDGGSSLQAILGTLVHEAIAQVLTELQAEGLIPAEDLVESEVEYAQVPGHLDRYESATQTLVDIKTTSQRSLDYVREHGIGRNWRYQTVFYAAALIKAGRPVKWVRLDVIARDTGDTESFVRPFDLEELREARAWLERIRTTPPVELRREYAPDSVFCGQCPWRTECWGQALPDRDARSVIWVEAPDAMRWVEQLLRGRALQDEGKKLVEEARGVLDGLRPNNRGTEYVDVGLGDRVLSFAVSERSSVDLTEVERVFGELGQPVPKKASRSVTVRVVKRPKAMQQREAV